MKKITIEKYIRNKEKHFPRKTLKKLSKKYINLFKETIYRLSFQQPDYGQIKAIFFEVNDNLLLSYNKKIIIFGFQRIEIFNNYYML